MDAFARNDPVYLHDTPDIDRLRKRYAGSVELDMIELQCGTQAMAAELLLATTGTAIVSAGKA